MFLPSDLNLENLGAVDFDKGCYTGQEVIARMHYLGKSKKSCIFLNTRSDRRYRTKQLINLVCNEIQPDLFIIRGDDFPKGLHELIDNHGSMEVKLFSQSPASLDPPIRQIPIER